MKKNVNSFILKISLYLAMFFAILPVNAEPVSTMPESVKNIVTQMDTVSYAVTQQKQVPDIDKKFISHGVLKFQKGAGFIFRRTDSEQETPYFFISTTTEYCTNEGKKKLKQLPHFSQIKSISDDFLSGDIDGFLTLFDVDFQPGQIWRMTCSPTQSEMADFIFKIEISGTNKDITSIIIHYTDDMVITFEFKRLKDNLPDEITC